MDDGVALARGLWSDFQDAALRFQGAQRRWGEAADAARLMWDDEAGRSVFQRFLDPHRELLASAESHTAAAIEAQTRALGSAMQAAQEAQRAAIESAQAVAAAKRARSQSGSVRSEVSIVRGEMGRARAMAQDVAGRIAGLGV